MALRKNANNAASSVSAKNDGHRPITRSAAKRGKTELTEQKVQKDAPGTSKPPAKIASTGKGRRERPSTATADNVKAKSAERRAKPPDPKPANEARKTKTSKKAAGKPDETVKTESFEDGSKTPPANATKKNGSSEASRNDVEQPLVKTIGVAEKGTSLPPSPKRKRSADEPVRNTEDDALVIDANASSLPTMMNETRKKSSGGAQKAAREGEETAGKSSGEEKLKKEQPSKVDSDAHNPTADPLAGDTVADLTTNHPYGFHTITARDALALEGWDLEQLDQQTCCPRTPPASQIPSPFALLTPDQEQLFLHIIDNHVLNDVRLLFHECRAQGSALQTLMLNGHDLVDGKGRSLKIESLVLASRASEGNVDDKDPIEAIVHNVPHDSNSLSMEIKSLSPKASPDFNEKGKSFEIRGIRNAKSGQRACFIINTDLDFLVINDLAVGRRMIAGPLPNFAVITIGHIAAFWWRSAKYWHYVPKPRGIKRKHGEEEEKQEDGDDKPPPDSTNWQGILNQGLTRFRRLAKGADKRKASPLRSLNDLAMEDITLAIGTIWEALRLKSIHYAFAGLDIFDGHGPSREKLPQNGVVGGGSTFIMPLYIPPVVRKRKEKGTKMIGHYVLGVANLDATTREANNVSIDIKDSAPGYMTPTGIINLAKDVVRRSGWLGSPLEEERIQPDFSDGSWPTVPCQPPGHHCGFYVILNAWAVMLEIPIHPHRKRRNRYSYKEFQALGHEIVNLATMGFMNSRTIQAFMNVYGYSEEQDPAEPEKHNVNAVRMSINKFDNIMRREGDKRKQQEWKDSGREITQAMVDEVEEFAPGADPVAIMDALRNEHGVIHQASARVIQPPDEPSPPISPHTPTMPEEQGADGGEKGTEGKRAGGGEGGTKVKGKKARDSPKRQKTSKKGGKP